VHAVVARGLRNPNIYNNLLQQTMSVFTKYAFVTFAPWVLGGLITTIQIYKQTRSPAAAKIADWTGC